MVKTKKAWIRIIEAFIAIMIVATAILIISSEGRGEINTEPIYNLQRNILNVISNNETYRNEVLNNPIPPNENCVLVDSNANNDYIRFIRQNLPRNLDFVTNICRIGTFSNKGIPNDIGNIYVSETIISAVYNFYPNDEARILRLLSWRER
ncbi:hypothetical protein J4221_05420 [Candidatus Pacearchaeota archaeon]|nr:hypothetical protein [Candidatus Pacearchaeota archaeon]